MTINLKPIYLGKCLEDLEKLYKEMPECNGKKLSSLLSTASKLHKKAEEFRSNADEEQSYVFYMRYFHLIQMIRENTDYSRNKKYVTDMLGGSVSQGIAIDILTDLSNSLQNRYNQLNSKNNTTIMNNIPKYLDGNSSSRMSIDSNGSSTNVSHFSSELSSYSSSSMDYSVNLTVQCHELFKMIHKQNPCESLLIMDCRSKMDFEKSRLHYPSCLNVPQEILKIGMSAGKIQQELEEKSRALWASRAVKNQIVLMDWDCKNSDPPPHCEIFSLRDILRNWDPDIQYRSPIKILEGGFEKFILHYPTVCTNPNVTKPTQMISSELEGLDDIEYPSIHDITMKDETKFIRNNNLMGSASIYEFKNQPPIIDRSSKLAAQKIYDDKKTESEVVKEREALVDKALKNEVTLLETETLWKNINKKVQNSHESEEQKSTLLAQQQDLSYKILQLENNERDFRLENERLRCELEETRQREKSYNEKITEIDAEALKLAEKRIEEKIKKQTALDEQREKEKLERMQIENAKEQKRHLKPSSEDGISQPKIPQFDRSVKPLNPIINNYTEQIFSRDFSPIRGSSGRGLTGLKNLGNTCYMNSIMQCLSNTSKLTEYFITNNYKTHVNRDNKTKGKIAEEVAALVKVLWNGQYKCVASKDLRYTIGQYQHIFSGIEQQDSHEFLTILMDWLHSDLQTLQTSESPRNHDNLRAAEKSWLDFTKSTESYILQLFYGQIKSIVKCISCSRESATYECFSNLSLELPQTTNRCQINDCLNLYFNGEAIRGWNCPSCKQKRDAIKKLSISKLPPILVIHLKRFYADPDGINGASTYRKKQNYVNFPLENLDMTPHIAKSETRSRAPKTYNLYSVSNHYGSMESGHYTAFCKSTVFNRWFKYDDQVVLNLDSSDVVSSAAYILFYTNLPLTSLSDSS